MSSYKSNKARLIWFNVDSLGPELFYGLLDAGRLPNFQRIFSKSCRIKVVTSFPTVSLTCQATIATGSSPTRHLITANAWFDRFGKRPVYRDYKNPESALLLFKYKKYGWPTLLLPTKRGPSLGNRDMSGTIPTVYEAVKARTVRSCVVFSHFSRGASEWLRPLRMDLIMFYLAQRGKMPFSTFDRAVTSRANFFINDETHLPRLMHIHFMGMGGYVHRQGPAAQEKYLEKTLDPLLGKILRALEGHKPLEEYNFALTSGFAQREIAKDRAHALDFSHIAEVFEAAGQKPYVPGTRQNPKRASVVLVPQGGALLVYMKNGETWKWYDLPRLNEDMLELGIAIKKISTRGTNDVPPGWLDMVLVNDRDGGDYRPVLGDGLPSADEFFSIGEVEEKYPDARRRLAGLQGKRSPDMVLLANCRDGFHFGLPGSRGQHGGLSREESIVPMVFSGPGIKNGSMPDKASVLDFLPTVCALFDVRTQDTEGISLPIFETHPITGLK